MTATSDRILTVPDVVTETTALALTGNEFVSLPVIATATGEVESVNVLHMGARGLIEFAGEPLLRPYVHVGDNAAPLAFDRLTYESDFVPHFQGRVGGISVGLRYVAPPGFKGFFIVLAATNEGRESLDVEVGLFCEVSAAMAAVFSRRALAGPHRAYFDTWTRSAVFEAGGGQPFAAFALRTADGAPWTVTPPTKWARERGGGVVEVLPISFAHGRRVELGPGEEKVQVYFCGVGSEGDGAGLNAVDLARHGWEKLFAKTREWLDARTRRVPTAQSQARSAASTEAQAGAGSVAEPQTRAEAQARINRNMFFSLFFAAGQTIDTEELVLVTSRSPRYYVSAAHWSRDSLLWTFPAVLMADPDLARKHLLAAFRLYTRNIGLHALYIDGTVLYPGFELDEVCAFAIALGRYVEATGDRSILNEQVVRTGLDDVIHAFQSVQHPEHRLGTTFLLPSDDPAHHPYVTYNNALLSLSWGILGELLESPAYVEEAARVRRSIQEKLIVPGPFGPMYCWSSDLEGSYILYDDPPGSLELLAHYGFVEKDDEVYRNTVSWIYSENNPYFDGSGRFGGPECPHARHPWLLTMSNGLLVGRDLVAQALAAPLDSGFACETFDRHTGVVKTGAAFASCAGFFAYALDKAVNG